MPQLYFHLYGEADVLFDPDGIDMPLATVAARALSEARALIAADVLSGRIDMRQRLGVEDDQGVTVCTLSFADAVQFVY